ncbi:MAG TPA: histidinol-phosphate transaminase [Sulfurimonas autotrophica]|nr:histidinol-phosphate transaminase [Sulfurimonas autotrophica]
MKFNKKLKNINTYEAGKPIELVVREFGIEPKDIIKLASNENPYGCSPKVQDAVAATLPNMALYPDDSMMKLKDALAKKYEVGKNNLIIGSGSDQVIEFIMHAKADENAKIVINSVTFAMYEIYARHVGAEVIRTQSQEHNLDEFYELYKRENPDIIFLCTPNNPTGDAIDAQALLEFLHKIDNDTLVVVDCAYMEYAAYKESAKKITPKELVDRFENVIYLGTFSKAYGLGGMRVGYGISSENIIQELSKLRPPFNITTLSLEAASVALEDEAFVNSCIALNFDEMKRYEAFANEKQIDIIESYTNFVTLCLHEMHKSTQICDALLRQGVIVRDLSGYGMNAIRITVGTKEQNSRFFELASVLL